MGVRGDGTGRGDMSWVKMDEMQRRTDGGSGLARECGYKGCLSSLLGRLLVAGEGEGTGQMRLEASPKVVQ